MCIVFVPLTPRLESAFFVCARFLNIGFLDSNLLHSRGGVFLFARVVGRPTRLSRARAVYPAGVPCLQQSPDPEKPPAFRQCARPAAVTGSAQPVAASARGIQSPGKAGNITIYCIRFSSTTIYCVMATLKISYNMYLAILFEIG